MVRKAQEDHLVIGFFGSGEVSSEAVEGHLDDYLATQPDNVTFVVPIVKTMWTDTLAAVVEYAIEHDIPYEAVHDEVSAKARNLSKYLKGATKTDLGARIGQKITNRLLAAGKENPKNALLAIAWDDDDKELHDVCAKVTAADIVTRDLVDAAFEEVDFSVEDDEKQEEQEEASKDRHPANNGTTSVVANDEPDDDDGEVEPYTREELEKVISDNADNPAAALKTLKEICDDYDIEVKPRTRMKTIVDMILNHQDVLAKVGGSPTIAKAGGGSITAAEVDYDRLGKVVRDEILGLLEPDEALDTAFGEVVSALEAITSHVAALSEVVAEMASGVPEMIEVTEDDESSENEPEDEPEPAAPARRRRRI